MNVISLYIFQEIHDNGITGRGNIFRLESSHMFHHESVCGKKPDTLTNIICWQTNRINLRKLQTYVLHLWTPITLV